MTSSLQGNQPLYVVFGATGAQGGPVARQLIAAGHRVRVVARSAGTLAAQYAGQAEPFAADLNDAAQVQAALAGAAGAFAHLPLPQSADAPQRQLGALLTAARAARLPLLVYSTSGFSGTRYPQGAFIAGNTAATQAVLASGVPAIVLQPTVYLENLLWPHSVAAYRAHGVLDYPPLAPTRRVSWTSLEDQARLAMAALQRPDLAGRAIEIATPPAATGGEVAELLGRWLGRPMRHAPLTPAAFGEQLAQAFGNPALGAGIAQMYADVDSLPADGTAVDTAALESLFGIRLPTLAQHIGAWPRATDGVGNDR